MTQRGRIAAFTGGGLAILILGGIVFFRRQPPPPAPGNGKNYASLQITLYVKNGQCMQQVGGQDVNFPEIYQGQKVQWETGLASSGQPWTLSFPGAPFFGKNDSGTPFENDQGTRWVFNFKGDGNNPTLSGPSTLTPSEKRKYPATIPTFPYDDDMTINGQKCSGAYELGLVVKPGI